MGVHKLSILVEAVGAAQANRKLRGIDRTISSIGARAGKGVRTTADNLARLGVVGAGVLAVGLVASVKAAGDFEAQLKTINTVAQRTPEQLDAIGKGIRQIARDTGTPLEDLTAGFYDLVSAGVAADQAQRVLASSNRLAIGGLGTAAEGVDLLTTALNSYGVAAQDQGAQSERFADIFAKSIEKGKITAAALAASFADIGPIAAKSGIEIEELAAGYATLTAQGVPAAEAATQMRSALVGLLSPNAKLNAIQKKTGVNFAKLAKGKGLVVALERLRVEAKKAGVPLIDVLGRVEGFNFAISATGDNLGAYNANLDDMGNSAGTAARQMSERQQGLNFELARLKALAIDAGVTIGSKLLPKLTPLVQKAVDFLNTHQSDLDAFGDHIASAFDKAQAFALKIPWEAVGSGLQIAAEWSGRLMDVFLNLPPGVQSTLIALAGLNKLSGGAVTGIVGELGKGLIKGVLGMNAGVVNINAGVVNGGGVGVPGGGPAGGGKGAGLRGVGTSLLRGAGVAAGGAMLLGSSGTTAEGALGNVAGGAIAGGSIAGPLGIIGGALAGLVKTTQEQQSAQSSAMGQGVSDKVAVMLGSNPTTQSIVTALNATRTGIDQIRSNPLNVLVAGDSLDSLNASQQALSAELARRGLADQRAGERSTSSIKASLTSLQSATAAKLADVGYKAQRAGERTAGVVAALKIPAPKVTVNVNVTARSIAASQAAQKRASASHRASHA